MNKKGVALYLVLAVLLVVVILANIILSLVSSQTQLTSHQAKRVQAQYAAQAGMNYALESLRINATGWMTNATPPGDNATFYMCREENTTDTNSPCNNSTGHFILEPDLPAAIKDVKIFVGPLNTVEDRREINITVNYTSY
jgi:Tfp pilus assembly protein PilX